MAEEKSSTQKQVIKKPYQLFFQLWFLIYFKAFFQILKAIVKRFSPQKSLKDKLIVVTGAGKGLGRQLSQDLAELGAIVACVDSDNAANEATVQLINKVIPGHAKLYSNPMNNPEDVKKVFDDITFEKGNFDMLIITDSLFGAYTENFSDDNKSTEILTRNLTGKLQIINHVLPNVTEKNDPCHIVIISSTVALSALESAPIYTTSEWATFGLAEGIYADLKKKQKNNVIVSCVCPYFTDQDGYTSSALDLRVGPLPLKQTSKSIITGISRERRLFSVPGYLYYFYVVQKLLPDNLNNSLNEILYKKFVGKQTKPVDEAKIESSDKSEKN